MLVYLKNGLKTPSYQNIKIIKSILQFSYEVPSVK